MNLLEFSGGGSIAVLATVLSISAPANALNFTIFSDRASWEAAVGGSFSEETFNSYTVDTSFNGTPLDVGDFTLNGTANLSSYQTIDVPPFFNSLANVDGTTSINALLDESSSFSITFDSPITAFGANFSSISTAGAIIQVNADSELVGGIPTNSNTGSDTEFFGFIGDSSFTTLLFDGGGVNDDVFGVDNVVYTSPSTPVPFEVSPTLGLLTIGGIWGISRLRKKRGVSKITK